MVYFFLIAVIDLYFEYFFGKNILGFFSPSSMPPDWPYLLGIMGMEHKIGSLIVGFLFPIISFWFYVDIMTRKCI